MKIKYYYIHGFGSSVNSETLKRFVSAGYDVCGLTYDYTNPKDGILNMVSEIMNSYDDYDWCIIIGSSLGGWYAEQVSSYVSGDYVLFNPAIDPVETLGKLGVSNEFLSKYRIPFKFIPTKRTVILATDDEVINYRPTEEIYKNKAKIKYVSGGHRITDTSFVTLKETLDSYATEYNLPRIT
jgi:uncharacterized protein